MARKPPHRHTGPGSHPTSGAHHAIRQHEKSANIAVSKLTAALVARGLSNQDALRYARVILTRPGITIGRAGNINYHGKRFDPAAFAQTKLVGIATGLRAKRLNEAAIQADPTYLNEMAQLGLNRSETLAPIADQRAQALIDFGDPRLAGADKLTAAAAQINPFSTLNLAKRAYQGNLQSVHQTANRAGTLFGGGLQSGNAQAGLENAQTLSEATNAIQRLLSGLSQNELFANQQYNVGQGQAYQDAYNELLSTGGLHAVKPPSWKVGQFHFFHPPKPKKPKIPFHNGGRPLGGYHVPPHRGFIPPPPYQPR